MSTLKLALIGNCQVQTYKVLLPLMLERDVDLAVFDISLPYTREEPAQLAFIETLAHREFVLKQRTDFHHINDDRLRERTRARFVRIGNFYFRGLHPDSCYIGEFGGRLELPSSVHSVIVLDAFRRGLSEAGAVRAFNPYTLERLGLAGAWQSSVEEMDRREANNFIDVPCRALMEAACRRYPAFLTMNHPSATLLADYLSRVLSFADIAHKPVNAGTIADPLAEHDCFPVLDAVAELNELSYRTTQRWRLNHFGRARFVSIEEYVAACYAAYREVEASRRLVHSPTDLVRQYREEERLRFLVDMDAAPPVIGDEDDDALAAGVVNPASLRSLMAAAVREETTALRLAAEELRTYVHKVHSYVETADPKIERIAHVVPQLARTEDVRTLADRRSVEADRAAAAPREPALRRLRRLLRLGRLRRWAGFGLAALGVMAAGAAWLGPR